jgi:hypothetical protein
VGQGTGNDLPEKVFSDRVGGAGSAGETLRRARLRLHHLHKIVRRGPRAF